MMLTDHCSLQLREKVLLRQQGSYILTVEAGKQLLLSADSGAEAALQAELTEIQERWKLATIRLEKQKKQLTFLLKVSALLHYGIIVITCGFVPTHSANAIKRNEHRPGHQEFLCVKSCFVTCLLYEHGQVI